MPLELRNDEGFCPFSPVWRWTPQNGKKKGERAYLDDHRSKSHLSSSTRGLLIQIASIDILPEANVLPNLWWLYFYANTLARRVRAT